jgi:hypothetical protein
MERFLIENLYKKYNFYVKAKRRNYFGKIFYKDL